MNVYKETKEMAQEAFEEANGNLERATDLLNEMVDGHEVCIYYGKAIQFCAEHDTSAGEEYLEDVGGIAMKGDTFGSIACRVAYATLWDEALGHLYEINEAMKQSKMEIA